MNEELAAKKLASTAQRIGDVVRVLRVLPAEAPKELIGCLADRLTALVAEGKGIVREACR